MLILLLNTVEHSMRVVAWSLREGDLLAASPGLVFFWVVSRFNYSSFFIYKGLQSIFKFVDNVYKVVIDLFVDSTCFRWDSFGKQFLYLLLFQEHFGFDEEFGVWICWRSGDDVAWCLNLHLLTLLVRFHTVHLHSPNFSLLRGSQLIKWLH